MKNVSILSKLFLVSAIVFPSVQVFGMEPDSIEEQELSHRNRVIEKWKNEAKEEHNKLKRQSIKIAKKRGLFTGVVTGLGLMAAGGLKTLISGKQGFKISPKQLLFSITASGLVGGLSYGYNRLVGNQKCLIFYLTLKLLESHPIEYYNALFESSTDGP